MPEYRELFASRTVIDRWFQSETVRTARQKNLLILRWIWVDSVPRDDILSRTAVAADGYPFIAEAKDSIMRGPAGSQKPVLPPHIPNIVCAMKLVSIDSTPRTIVMEFDKAFFQVQFRLLISYNCHDLH